MKEKRFSEKPACSVRSAPFPFEVTCPQCGYEIELWTDEDETVCGVCYYMVFKHEKTVH